MTTIDERFIRGFLAKHNINVTEKDKGDKKILMLEKCPFNENHTGSESALIIHAKGNVGFCCKHDSCKDKKIRDFICHYEPGFTFGNPKADNKATKEKTTKGPGEKPKIQCVADVERKDIKYLLRPYIVANNITALVGDGGVGKTFVWVDIASAVTRGELPAVMGVPEEFKNKDQGNITENRRVLYFTSEDGTDTTLKDRFEWAGADQRNLFFISLDDENFHNILLDSTELEEIIAEVRPALCVLDPLQSFVRGKMAERNNMRRQLDCLTRLGSVYNVAFLIVVHTNKQATSDARTKLSDSSDIWDKCRSVLFVGKTGAGSRYLSQEKGNYTNADDDIGTQLFKIDDGHIKHQGTTDKKYREFMAETTFQKDTSIRDSAKEFILTSLKAGEMLVKDLDESALSFGISKTTYGRAKRELKDSNKIRYRTDTKGKGQGTTWYISLNTLSKD